MTTKKLQLTPIFGGLEAIFKKRFLGLCGHTLLNVGASLCKMRLLFHLYFFPWVAFGRISLPATVKETNSHRKHVCLKSMTSVYSTFTWRTSAVCVHTDHASSFLQRTETTVLHGLQGCWRCHSRGSSSCTREDLAGPLGSFHSFSEIWTLNNCTQIGLL